MCDMTNHDIETRLDDIANKLDRMDRTLEKLNITVRGDTQYGATGIAPRTTELERRVTRIETMLNRAIWVATGAGLAGAGIAELIKAILGGG